MAIAAFGYVPPAIGALIQEAIDVAVILNALRAVRPGALERAMHAADERAAASRAAAAMSPASLPGRRSA
jgi:hypothetical protein